MISNWFVTIIVLLFTPVLASANASYGLFMVVKGDVKVINVQNQSNPVKVGSKILPGETVVSGADSRAKIVMSDRNVINISPGTTLKIEKYENNPQTGEKNVLINLQDGKARTNVEQKYDGEKNKFQIRTPTAVAGVRGTQFLVSFDASSQMTQVVTLKGAVSFAPANLSGAIGGEAVMVRKGESTSVAPGAAAPEPPKAIPKEELRRIDKESASTAPAKTDTKQAKGPAAGDGKKSTDGKREPASNGSGGTQADAGGGSSPGGMLQPTEKPPEVEGPRTQSPVTALPTQPPAQLPKIPAVVETIIQNPYQQTKVIITPVVQ